MWRLRSQVKINAEHNYLMWALGSGKPVENGALILRTLSLPASHTYTLSLPEMFRFWFYSDSYKPRFGFNFPAIHYLRIIYCFDFWDLCDFWSFIIIIFFI